MKKLIAGSFLAATFAAAALPAAAATSLYVELGAPPTPRYELVPAPRAGLVWVPGYWEARRHRHHWVAGHWVRHRPGYVYAPARWAQHDGRWRYYAPSWDRDGDGIPNRYDRAPNNPRYR